MGAAAGGWSDLDRAEIAIRLDYLQHTHVTMFTTKNSLGVDVEPRQSHNTSRTHECTEYSTLVRVLSNLGVIFPTGHESEEPIAKEAEPCSGEATVPKGISLWFGREKNRVDGGNALNNVPLLT
ncbi:hypothetical protein CHU98_g9996 [Xylaria longipes]|nr:hypothetical protein CHU98_g9996 [Xylaria longipes]